MSSDGRRDNRSRPGAPPRRDGASKPSGGPAGKGTARGKGKPPKGRPPGKGGAGGKPPKGRPPGKGGAAGKGGAELAGPQSWGRIARGGAGRMDSPAIGTEGHDDFPSRRPRPRPVDAEPDPTGADATDGGDAGGPGNGERAGGTEAPVEKRPPPRPERRLPDADDLARHAEKAVRRSRGPAARRREPLGARPLTPEDPASALERLVGRDRAKSLHRKLKEAARAFEAERYGDARAALRPVIREAPELPDGRELMGLTLYRLGKWEAAIEELETFRAQTHSTEQHPVLMDCHRARGRWSDVDDLWAELGAASPAAELVTEGRIVLAGAYADQDDVPQAIRTLETGWKPPKRPHDHHLRRAYALADLYDRAGKRVRARELFGWIAGHDPRFADVKSRVKALS